MSKLYTKKKRKKEKQQEENIDRKQEKLNQLNQLKQLKQIMNQIQKQIMIQKEEDMNQDILNLRNLTRKMHQWE